MDARAGAVLEFWQRIGPAGWYGGGEALDSEIRSLFLADWQAARVGGLRHWQASPEGVLAYLILTDQFPRNMFRDDGLSFATDSLARDVASRAWQHGMDLRIEGPLRQFLYLPFMHSETLTDQDRSVALFVARLPGDNVLHARAHRQVIRDFGRFPYRNAALGRQTTAAEAAFLAAGSYGAVVRALGG